MGIREKYTHAKGPNEKSRKLHVTKISRFSPIVGLSVWGNIGLIIECDSGYGGRHTIGQGRTVSGYIFHYPHVSPPIPISGAHLSHMLPISAPGGYTYPPPPSLYESVPAWLGDTVSADNPLKPGCHPESSLQMPLLVLNENIALVR